MLHCPSETARAHNSFFRNLFLATGLYCRRISAAELSPATGGWRTVSPISGSLNATAACGAWWPGRKTPGGKDTAQSGCVKAEQADAGNADPDRYEEKSRRRRYVGRPSLQRQGRPALQLHDQAGRSPTSLRFRAACWASSAAAKPGPASGPPIPSSPSQQHGQQHGQGRAPKGTGSAKVPTAHRQPPQHRAEDRRRGGAEGCSRSKAGGRPARPIRSAISAYSPTSRGLPISAGWNSSTAASVVTQRQRQQFTHARGAGMTR